MIVHCLVSQVEVLSLIQLECITVPYKWLPLGLVVLRYCCQTFSKAWEIPYKEMTTTKVQESNHFSLGSLYVLIYSTDTDHLFLAFWLLLNVKVPKGEEELSFVICSEPIKSIMTFNAGTLSKCNICWYLNAVGEKLSTHEVLGAHRYGSAACIHKWL